MRASVPRSVTVLIGLAILNCIIRSGSKLSKLNLFTTASSSPVVELQDGSVQGNSTTSRNGRIFFEFKGIPFAKPPVGELRFEPPQAPEKWNGIRNARVYSNKCPQFNIRLNAPLGNEDCLYLNVFSPMFQNGHPSPKLVPVIVFVHGGRSMNSAPHEYNPHYFMDHDIVLVHFNYRLSALGFLSTQDGVVPGNMGLKDQVMALKWVQRSIAKFGGDPRRVTLMGHSTGGTAVSLHLVSNLSKGLFHKAIQMSGSSLRLSSLVKTPRRTAKRLAQYLNCSHPDTKQMINCLKAIEVQRFIEFDEINHKGTLDQGSVLITGKFGPCLEKTGNISMAFLVEHPYKLFKEGKAMQIPYIIGTSSEEGLRSTGGYLNRNDVIDQIENHWDVFSHILLHYDSSRTEITQRIRRQYQLLGNKLNFFESLDNITNLISDRFYLVGSRIEALVQGQYAPVYVYYYKYKGNYSYWRMTQVMIHHKDPLKTVSHPSANVSEWWRSNVVNNVKPHLGVGHGDILGLLFKLPNNEINERSPDYEASKELVGLWTQFAVDERSMALNGQQWRTITPNETILKYLQFSSLKSETGYFEQSKELTDRLNFWKGLDLLPFDDIKKIHKFYP